MLNNILEISKRACKGGRVPIKIALLKIHEEATETNSNGLHWDETYVTNAIDSVSMMPICAAFCDDTKSVPLDHGLTGEEVDENGVHEPLFENSETVGCFEKASIENVTVNDNEIRALVANGYLFKQRYPAFVKWVRENYATGTVDTSIEIMGLDVNDNKIVYLEDNPTDKFRTPKEFVFSGSCILSVTPADENAVVLEVAQKKENKEDNTMEFDVNEIKSVIQSTIAELNNKDKAYEDKIAELNTELEANVSKLQEKDAEIEAKNSEINALSATVEQVQKALDDLQKEHEAYWEERQALEKELGKLKAERRIAEMNEVISIYTDEEKKFAESEINSFKENPLESDIEAIKSKICVGIVSKQKEDAKVSEVNSTREVDVEDIFSEMCSEDSAEEDEDTNIF